MKTKLSKVLGLLLALAIVATQMMLPAFAATYTDCSCTAEKRKGSTLYQTVDPTCTTYGYSIYTCKTCKKQYVDEYVAPDDSHTLQHVEAKEAECGVEGWDAYDYCTKCGYTTKVSINASLGHLNLIKVDAQEPDCVNVGWEAYEYCGLDDEICDYTTYVEIPALGHTPGEPVEENRVEATCTTDGSFDTVVYCTVENCGAEISRVTTTLPRAEYGHSYGTGPVDRVEPTCTADGYEIFVCTVEGCGFRYTHNLKKLGHDNKTVEGTPATCTKTGLTSGTVCNRCGVTTKAQTVIAAKGHKPEITVAAKNATCGADGNTAEVKCTTCKVVLTPSEVIPATGNHTKKTIAAKAPTCTATGLTEGEQCSTCKTWFVKQQTIPALGHNSIPKSGVIEATCENESYQLYVCTVCNYETKKILAPALGHDTVDHEAKAATCTEIGWDAYQTCNRCDYTTYEEIAALGHRLENIPPKKATCTEPGNTAGQQCARCGIYTKEPFYFLNAHTEVEIPAVEATETQVGYTAGTKCSVCGTTVKAPQAIDEEIFFTYEATGINGVANAVNSGFVTLKVYLNVASDYARLWGADIKVKFNENLTVISGCNEETDKLFDLIKTTNLDTANANGFITINQSNMNYPDPAMIKDNVFKKTGEDNAPYLFATLTFKVDKDFYNETVDFEVVVDDCDVARVEDENSVVVDYGMGDSITIDMLGDVNGDGKLSVNDSLALTQWVATGEAYNHIFDMNKDGFIDGDDFALMRGAIVQDDTYLDK